MACFDETCIAAGYLRLVLCDEQQICAQVRFFLEGGFRRPL